MIDEDREAKLAELEVIESAGEEQPQPAQDPAAPEPTANAVLILRNEGEDGTISTEVTVLGDVKATEVQTVIELGLRRWRGKLGLDA